MPMGIPLDITLIYTVLAIILFLFTGLLLFFDETTFNRVVFAMMLCFINGIFSFMTALSYFSIDLFGFTIDGEIVSNPTNVIAPYGLMFILFVYINLMLTFYCVYLFYEKPWKKMLQSWGKKTTMWYEEQM
jgi:hypothetical protein